MKAFADTKTKVYFHLDKNKYKKTRRGSTVLRKEKRILKGKKRALLKKELVKEVV